MYIEIYDSTNPKCKFTVGSMYSPPHTATAQLTSLIDYFTDRLSLLKVLEKCTKNLIGHSRLAFNNHESNIVC